jgi:cytochrome c oxidase subunit 2
MKHFQRGWRLPALLGTMVLLLAGCTGQPSISTLLPQGEGAKMLYDLLILTTIVMALVVVVVTILFIIVTTRFRRTKENENDIPEQVEGSHKLELLWTVIPIILLIFIAVPTVKATFEWDVAGRDDMPEDAVKINVTGKLYWWEFEYEDEEIITSQDMVIPAGERVYLSLTSGDVKHAFWVPAIQGKIDTNPEGENYMWIQAYEPGVYDGKCTELCGPSHALMDFKVKVVSPEEYEEWVAGMQEPSEAPQSELAVQGEEIFNQSCISCHAVESEDTRPSNARTAPNLSNFADRERIAGILEFNDENLKSWIQDPESIKPGNKMTGTYPKVDVNDEQQIDALIEYLKTLSKEN